MTTDTNPAGIWIVTLLDWNDIPQYIGTDELDARRWADANYGEVRFWRLGTEWHKAQKTGHSSEPEPRQIDISGMSDAEPVYIDAYPDDDDSGS